MNSMKYIVVSIEKNECPDCDGRPEKIGEYATYEEAKDVAIQELRELCDYYTLVDDVTGKTFGPSAYDETKMFVSNHDGSASCQFAIIETQV